LDRGQRELGEHVVAGGAAFASHLGCADQRRQVLVLHRAPAAYARLQIEVSLEVVTVEASLREAGLCVVVTVDQARDQRAPTGIDVFRAIALHRAARYDIRNGASVDEDVERLGLEGRRENESILYEDHVGRPGGWWSIPKDRRVIAGMNAGERSSDSANLRLWMPFCCKGEPSGTEAEARPSP